MREKGKRELTTIVGNLAGLSPGEHLSLDGRWTVDPKYGSQFRVEQARTTVPATVDGIEKYLGSGFIRGIGPVMARRIVRVFGADALNIIENSPEKLAQVDGVGPKRIAMIAKAWVEQREIKEIMVFLQSHGISAALAAKIYKQYLHAAIETVRENPYCLAADIKGIGFVTADRIARSLGIDPGSPARAAEGLLHVLNGLAAEGHVYCPLDGLLDKAAAMLEVEKDIVIAGLGRLQKELRLVVDSGAAYLPALYAAETRLAENLLALSSAALPSHRNIEQALEQTEKELSLHLADEQKKAALLALSRKVTVITGGPGTGKTTIIKSVAAAFHLLGLRVSLAAPTGRAARRMREATGFEAKTIHRLLKFDPLTGGFQYNQNSPLEADAVIIDETSMVDVVLMHHLVKAVPRHAALILVGDIDQLPSVGPGNVLRDIIGSGKFAVAALAEIFRQARGSRIVTNAHRINRGEFPDTSTSTESDFYFIKEEDPEKAVKKILSLCRDHVPRRFGLHPARDIQVLAPMYRGAAGVDSLNAALQDLLNPGGRGITRGSRAYKVGDKVMQTANNYDKEVFNGDVGWIAKIDPEDQELVVDFDGRAVTYLFAELDELAIAYAVSVHKIQGSEYPAVIMALTTQHYMMLQRNLLYTGITRGKKLVVLVGAPKALAMAVKNNKPQNRHSRLRERLAAAGEESPGNRRIAMGWPDFAVPAP